MTTSNIMSLPVDIVWKRLALDNEMMWIVPSPQHPSIKPPRWKPSVTIFYAHPQPDSVPDDYKNTIITYLKVTCSITGTIPLPGDVMMGKTWPPYHEASKIIAKSFALYYGCYGAILEVTVEPYKAAGVPIDEYPYFLDFQPKKREIFEAVSISGESLSGSKETVSIRKSTTSLDSLEVGEGLLPHTVPEAKMEFREEFSNVRNIDASRESRETFSHTTNLSQLYHHLDSYHLGTNRAMFFLQPRPHFEDPEYQTFLWGP
ncbi:MAG TPA: hypothetical protein DIU00_03775 [Phycisphaerales bacterium]|nr:hypothetical protein [Phycisphaerales bacterium]